MNRTRARQASLIQAVNYIRCQGQAYNAVLEKSRRLGTHGGNEKENTVANHSLRRRGCVLGGFILATCRQSWTLGMP
jgi:hypothetical protein